MIDAEPQVKLDQDPILLPDPFVDAEDAEFEIVSVLDGRLAEAFAALPEELVTCSEFALCEKVDPNPSDYRMRQNFHDAVSVARAKGKKLRVASVYEDVISRQTFFNWYVPNSVKMAFIFRPVIGHHQYYDAIHKAGLRKLFLYVRNHDLDPKHVATFMRIVEKAGDRSIGPVVQKIAMHQKQEVTHTSTIARDVGEETPQELEERIREAQARLDKIKPVEIEARSLDQD